MQRISATGRPCRRSVLTAGCIIASITASTALPFTATAQSREQPKDQTQAPAADPALRDYFAANGLLNRGLFDQAAAEYRKFLSEHARHHKAPIARYGLSVCLFRLNQFEPAVAELSQLADQTDFAFAAEVATMLGQCRLQQREFDKAAESFERVLRHHAGHDLSDDAAAGLIEALHGAGKHDEAATQATAFARKWSDSPLRDRVAYFAGLSELSRSADAAAADRFAVLIEQYPDSPLAEQATLLAADARRRTGATEEARRLYQSLLDRPAGRFLPDALYGLALLLHADGRPREAGELLDRLLKRHSDSSPATAARFLRARTWFDQNSFDRAAVMFEQVAATEGDWRDDAAYWLAKCDLRRDDAPAAARRLHDAIRDFPQSDVIAEMRYDMGVALLRAEKPADAIDALREFRKRHPQHALAGDALHMLAVTLHRQKRYDDSLACCREFLELNSTHPRAAAMLFLTAENEFLAGRLDPAMEGFRQFLRHYPDDEQAPRARFRLGTALARLNRTDEAAPLLREAAAAGGVDGAMRASLLALGDIQFQRGDWAAAEQTLGNYLASSSDLPAVDDALLKLGIARVRQGRHAQAVEAFDELLKRHRNSSHRPQAVFERGQALLAMDRTDDAARAFESVVSDDDAARFATFAWNHLASIALQRRLFSRAVECFDQLLAATPDDALRRDAQFRRACALMSAGDFAAAAEAMERFLRENAEDDRANQARARLAIALSRQNRHADAVRLIERLEKEGPDRLDGPLRSALAYEKAWCLKALGQPDRAAEALKSLVESNAAELAPHAALELAELHAAAGRHAEAAQLLSHLRDTWRKDATRVPPAVREPALYRLGVCAFEQGNDEAAAKAFEEVLDEYPDSGLRASAGYFAGEALARLGRHDAAARALAQVVEKHSDDPAYGPALLRLGESLAALQRWARSEEAFAAYLQRFGDEAQAHTAHFGIGWARENQGRVDEAISAYREVIARHQEPTAARAQFQIGECLFAKKQYEPAARELLKVDILYAYPEWSAAALYEAGRCFERLSRPEDARAQFQTVVDKHANTKWAPLAAQRLEALAPAKLPGR